MLLHLDSDVASNHLNWDGSRASKKHYYALVILGRVERRAASGTHLKHAPALLVESQADGEGEENGSSQDGGGSRKSLLLVMEQERGVKLEARRRRWAVTWPPLPTHHREGVVVRVETPNERRVPPEDINSSWPRLHSLKVNEGEASSDVVAI